eukprot:521410_1
MASSSQQGESWNCKKCGNENFGWRSVCNMRNCRTPKSPEEIRQNGEWICPECQNNNYSTRLVCNMRTCRAKRPSMQPCGLPPSKLGLVPPGGRIRGPGRGVGSGFLGVPSAVAPLSFAMNGSYAPPLAQPPLGANAQFPGGLTQIQSLLLANMLAGAGAGAGQLKTTDVGTVRERVMENGDWICPICNNRNFANRTRCNIRACNAPRPSTVNPVRGAAVSGGGGRRPELVPVMVPQQTGRGQVRSYTPQVVPVIRENSYRGDGSFVEREPYVPDYHPSAQEPYVPDYAPSRVRSFDDVGDRRAKRARTAPVVGADWTCTRCDLPRDAGATECWKCGEVRPKLNWRCVECGNVNYATRDVCNMRRCGKPRPTD